MFEEGVTSKTISVRILDDICRDPETIEMRIHSVATNDAHACGAQASDATRLNCFDVGVNRSVSIQIQDQEDPDHSEPAWLALVSDPAVGSADVFRVQGPLESPDENGFGLTLEMDGEHIHLGPFDHVNEIQQHLMGCPFVTSAVEATYTGNDVVELVFGDSPYETVSGTFTLTAYSMNASSSTTNVRVTTARSPLLSHVANRPLNRSSVVEVRNTCDRTITTLQSGVMEASMSVPWGAPCLRNAQERSAQKYEFSIKPLVKFDGDVTVAHNVSVFYITSNPSNDVLPTYNFEKSTRSRVDYVFLSNGTDSTAGTATRVKGVSGANVQASLVHGASFFCLFCFFWPYL